MVVQCLHSAMAIVLHTASFQKYIVLVHCHTEHVVIGAEHASKRLDFWVSDRSVGVVLIKTAITIIDDVLTFCNKQGYCSLLLYCFPAFSKADISYPSLSGAG